MLNGLQYRIQLSRLQANKRRIIKTHRKLINQAKEQKKPNPFELEKLFHDERFEVEEVDDDIWDLQMQYLSKQAEQYLLPKPEFKKVSEWIESKFTGRWRLSPGALAKLRTAIRQEQKERREFWTTLITLSIGLGGVLIGVIALLKKYCL